MLVYWAAVKEGIFWKQRVLKSANFLSWGERGGLFRKIIVWCNFFSENYFLGKKCYFLCSGDGFGKIIFFFGGKSVIFCAEVIEGWFWKNKFFVQFLFFLKNNFLGKKCYFLCSGDGLGKIIFFGGKSVIFCAEVIEGVILGK